METSKNMKRRNNSNIGYYDKYAKRFVEESMSADMSEIYQMFLEFVPKGGKTLDEGCGRGEIVTG